MTVFSIEPFFYCSVYLLNITFVILAVAGCVFFGIFVLAGIIT